MAFQTRSAVLALKKEVTEGTLVQPTVGADFTVLREGFEFAGEVEVIDSDELVNDIGASKSFLSKETPNLSVSKFWKHSGVEGQEPDYGELIEAGMGTVTVNSTEYDTIAGATAGTALVAATVVVDAGEGVNFKVGQALLIKDGTNGYQVRNITAISTDTLTLNYNVAVAPGVGVNLGKAIHYQAQATGHPTLSAHLYQAGSNSAYQQAQAGVRVTSMGIEGPANGFLELNFDGEGIEYFLNPQVVDATNLSIDFTDSSSTVVASLEQKTYKTPVELAREVATKMTAASVDTISCSFSDATGLYTIASDGGTLSLLWLSGANTATAADALLGFDTIDESGVLTYDSDSAQSYDPPVTPAFDDVDPLVVKSAEILLGSFDDNACRQGNNLSGTIGTPKQDVDDFCSESGVSESIVSERTVEMSLTLILKKHEVRDFDKFINNTTTQFMMNVGQKSGGNWVAGTVANMYMHACSITSDTIVDEDGIQVRNVDLKGFVTSSKKDVHLNFL